MPTPDSGDQRHRRNRISNDLGDLVDTNSIAKRQRL